jgi:hypothetical protein
VAGAALLVVSAPAAHAAATGTGGGGTACKTAPAGTTTAPGTTGVGTPASDASVASAIQYKAQHDLLAGQRPTAAELAAAAAHDAKKEAMLASGQMRAAGAACAGTGTRLTAAYATSAAISWMYQYPQITNWYCGPAVVSEMSATVPGSSPYNLNQNTVATYMGTTTNGTNYAQETNGLNHYVGIPDFNWAYYGMAWMSDPPTTQQKADFSNRLAQDVSQSSPIAGLAYEVAGGPHLVGHPVNQNIGHWIEIGGYNSTQVWYADSATSVWPNTVPTYSWFDTSTMEIILGGAGYIW